MERPGPHKPIDPGALAWGVWAWLFAGVALAAFAWAQGGARIEGAVMLALAAIPALSMFLLARYGRQPWMAAAMLVVWTGFATGATAMTGGVTSPLLAAFLIGPALATRLGDARTVFEALVAAAAGYALAALAGAPAAGTVGWAEAAGGFACLMFALWVLAAPSAPSARAQDDHPDHLVMPVRSAAALHAATMAHELRTPLTHILGFAELIQAQIFGPLNDKYVEYAGLIRSSGAHLLAMVNDLMDLAKIEAGRLELEPVPFDARAVGAEVLAEAEGQAQTKGVSLRLMGDATAPVVADPRAFRQVLLNLIGNAVKFTPTGGSVQLDIRGDAGGLTLVVRDTGPGFPPNAFATLATPFTRADNAGDVPGTGLGLALVRSLVEAQGGSLHLANSDEGGAEVTVRLPAAVVS